MDALGDPIAAPQQAPAGAPRKPRVSSAAALARRLGLRLVTTEALTIQRRRAGRGFAYYGADGRLIRDRAIIARLRSLAIPPAYVDVL